MKSFLTAALCLLSLSSAAQAQSSFYGADLNGRTYSGFQNGAGVGMVYDNYGNIFSYSTTPSYSAQDARSQRHFQEMDRMLMEDRINFQRRMDRIWSPNYAQAQPVYVPVPVQQTPAVRQPVKAAPKKAVPKKVTAKASAARSSAAGAPAR
jgi:hypothetical protein